MMRVATVGYAVCLAIVLIGTAVDGHVLQLALWAAYGAYMLHTVLRELRRMRRVHREHLASVASVLNAWRMQCSEAAGADDQWKVA